MSSIGRMGPHDPKKLPGLHAPRKPQGPAGKRYIIKPGSTSEAIYFREGTINGMPQRFILQLPGAPAFYMHKKHVGEARLKEGDPRMPEAAPSQDASKPSKTKAHDTTQQSSSTITNTRITYIMSQTSRLESDYIDKGIEIAELGENKWLKIAPSNTDFVFKSNDEKETSPTRQNDPSKVVFSVFRKGEWFFVHNSSGEEISVWVGEDAPNVPKPTTIAPSPAAPLEPVKTTPSELKLPDHPIKPLPESIDALEGSQELLAMLISKELGKKNAASILPASEKTADINVVFKKAMAAIEPDGFHMTFNAYMNKGGEIVGYGPVKTQTEEMQSSINENRLVTARIRIATRPNKPGPNFSVLFEKPLPENPSAAQQKLEEIRKATEEELNSIPNPFLGKVL